MDNITGGRNIQIVKKCAYFDNIRRGVNDLLAKKIVYINMISGGIKNKYLKRFLKMICFLCIQMHMEKCSFILLLVD